MSLLVLTEADVFALLDQRACIALMRDAMIGLSRGQVTAPQRQILTTGKGLFGAMAGVMAESFGAKLLSVYPASPGRTSSHEGAVLLFEPEEGLPVAIVHAGAITALRTAAASAAATDALARPDATRLAVLGTGHQADQHVRAIREVRPLSAITIWGRDGAKASACARRIANDTGIRTFTADTPALAVADADIVCTVTAAAEPILSGVDVRPGTHLNVVGSSHAGPAEIDATLVAAARFVADHRPSVLAQGAEFLRARSAGLVGDAHVVGEIGEILDGRLAGRATADEITIYKSLGHIAQDLAAAWHVYDKACATSIGTVVSF